MLGWGSLTLPPALVGFAYRHVEHHHEGEWEGWWIGLIVALALLAIVIALAVLFVRWVIRQTRGRPEAGTPTGGQESALRILSERYARGEVSREEYEEKKRDLT